MNGLSLESENLPLSAEKTVSTRCSVPKKDLFREKERAATHSTQTWQATCTHTAQLPRWRGIYRRKEIEEVQLQRRTLSLAWGFLRFSRWQREHVSHQPSLLSQTLAAGHASLKSQLSLSPAWGKQPWTASSTVRKPLCPRAGTGQVRFFVHLNSPSHTDSGGAGGGRPGEWRQS